MGLAIYDAQGVKRFEKMYGTFAPDQRVAIASASKMVAGLTMLRLVDQGFLTLDSTTGAVLGWTGPQGAITLRQLLSFTSGLPREAPCTLLQDITLADCVDAISQYDAGGRAGHALRLRQHASARRGAHGGSGHRCQRGPNIFATQLKTPLGLGAGHDVVHGAAPGRRALRIR